MLKKIITIFIINLATLAIAMSLFFPTVLNRFERPFWNRLYSSSCSLEIRYPKEWTGMLIENEDMFSDCVISLQDPEDPYFGFSLIRTNNDDAYISELKTGEQIKIGNKAGHHKRKNIEGKLGSHNIYFEEDGYAYIGSYNDLPPDKFKVIEAIYNSISFDYETQEKSYVENESIPQ